MVTKQKEPRTTTRRCFDILLNWEKVRKPPVEGSLSDFGSKKIFTELQHLRFACRTTRNYVILLLTHTEITVLQVGPLLLLVAGEPVPQPLRN